MYEIYHFVFVKGGPVMYPIVLGSVVALALFLERVWALRRDRVIPPVFQRRLRLLVRDGKLSEAEVLCQENASALANVTAAGIKQVGNPKDEIRQAIVDVGRREVSHLERFVEFMGTIAAVEPLMGLLGTVTGLIRAFQQVEAVARGGGGVKPELLAGGIWEALITTAAGLIVAIPAYLGYRFLQGRINTLAVEMEEDALRVAEMLSRAGSREDAPRFRRAGEAKPAADGGDRRAAEEERDRDTAESEEEDA